MNIFKITEEEKRKILNSHRSASIVKEQTNGGINFKPKTPQELAQELAQGLQGVAPAAPAAPAAAPADGQKVDFSKFKKDFPASFDQSAPAAPVADGGINYKVPTPQELAKGVASAATAAPTTPAVKGNPMIAKLQQTLIDKFKVNLGNTGPNKNGVDGYMGINTANGIKKALEMLKSAPAGEVATKTDTTQQKKFDFKNPNFNFNPDAIQVKQPTPQELSKGVQMAAVNK
jgi:hypothetical protein